MTPKEQYDKIKRLKADHQLYGEVRSLDGECNMTRDLIYPDLVKRRVEAVREIAAYDDEEAHIQEEDLHTDVLHAIANDKCDNPRECATIALSTRVIEFDRRM